MLPPRREEGGHAFRRGKDVCGDASLCTGVHTERGKYVIKQLDLNLSCPERVYIRRNMGNLWKRTSVKGYSDSYHHRVSQPSEVFNITSE